MFGFLFGKKSNARESLQKKYDALMEESYKLSHSNRKQSDLKRSQAEEIGKRLDALEKQQAERKD